jgi:glucosamine--fructose-6-phosphate aminotransferase (isomerizing)
MVNSSQKRGFYTEAEIRSEPRIWAELLGRLREDPEMERIVQEFSQRQPWIFIGCGSSYYLALAAAASWTSLTGLAAKAYPASELLLFPELVLDSNTSSQPVLISRSGTTSEVIRAGEYLNTKGIPWVAVTCAPGKELEKRAAAVVRVFAADEKSTVMTRSFTSMVVALQYLAARLAGNTAFLDALRAMPEAFQPVLEEARTALKAFLGNHTFADYVWLGQGPYYGLACEGALKVNEMSCSYAQSFHTLEFRHGPKSIVGPETLIMFQLSEAGCKPESDVLQEVKDLGGTTLVVVNQADDRTRRAADLLVELHLKGHEYARLAAHVVPAQLVGLEAGLKKGLDPDSPRNLSRAVILGNRI